MFGSSSERRLDDIADQLYLFNKVENCQHEEMFVPDIETTVKSHTRKAKITLEEKLKGIPVEKVIVDFFDEDKLCPQCGTELELIGKETIRQPGFVNVPTILEV